MGGTFYQSKISYKVFLKQGLTILSFFAFLFFCFPSFARETNNLLILEPVIQGYVVDEPIEAIERNGTYYLPLIPFLQVLEFRLTEEEGGFFAGYFLSEKNIFSVDVKQHLAESQGKKITLPAKDVLIENDDVLLSIKTYETLFPVTLKVDMLGMQLEVASLEKLPLKRKEEAKKRRSQGYQTPKLDTFKNYAFDERWFSAPVLDINYRKTFSKLDIGGNNENTSNSDSYTVDMGMLFAGLDARATVFGDTTIKSGNPRARFSLGRTFLEDPKNMFNLVKLQMGDVVGFNSTLFSPSASGRGIFASSFKDLVMSSDKTIDINGPLSEGWEVELYLNDQLIGFKQTPKAGNYEFKSIPVSYGLNVFKLVFYGPYGEIRTEERRYYSGTSPVKKGEFGYIANAYQAGHYLLEDSEPFVNPSDKPTIDLSGYYGITDNITANAGYTLTYDSLNPDVSRQFATAGLQVIFEGASFQYNTLYDLKSEEVGHHVDVQGDIFIGDLLARYEYYGDLKSPSSFQGLAYLTELFEGRLTGVIPLISMPYYVSYQETKDENDMNNQTITARLSPNFLRYFNLTLEDVWQKNDFIISGSSNTVSMIFQAQFDKLGIHAGASYRTHPSDYLMDAGAKVDYLWDKNTYFRTEYRHDFRSRYSTADDLDTLTLGAARLFPFGGLTLDFSGSSDKNVTVSLGYNISFGKMPGTFSLFTNSQTKLSERSTVLARLKDESGLPVSDVQLIVNGVEKPVVTDENGEALIADIEPYQRTLVYANIEDVPDVALSPLGDTEKWVFRPGTVFALDIPFVHKGAIEGQLIRKNSRKSLRGYTLQLTNEHSAVVHETYSDVEGFFIFDEVLFGAYGLQILSPTGKVIERLGGIKLDAPIYTFEQGIEVTDVRSDIKPSAPVPVKLVRSSGTEDGFYVQLLAAYTEKNADDYWRDVQQKTTLLKGYSPIVVLRDLDDEAKELYRLRVGPFKAKGEAEILCGKLKQSKIDCFVTR